MFQKPVSLSAISSIRMIGFVVLASVLVAGCAPSSTYAETTAKSVNYEGLADAASRAFDIAQVRPGVDFSAYSGIVIGAPELAYRTPDRSALEFPLSEEQKDNLRDMVIEAFRSELSELAALQLAGEPGEKVLRLNIRIEDISAIVSSKSLGAVGRASAFLEASAEATLVLELRDSRSNEILARGVDVRTVEGAALSRPDRTVETRFEDVEKVCRRWAAVARAGLEALVAGQ